MIVVLKWRLPAIASEETTAANRLNCNAADAMSCA